MNVYRLLDLAAALHLTIGICVAAVLRPVLGAETALFTGAGVAVLVAVSLTVREELDPRVAWHVGLLTIGFYVVSRVGSWAVGGTSEMPDLVLVPFAALVSALLYWAWER